MSAAISAMNVLVFNGGSSSLKYKLVAFGGDGSETILNGETADAPGGDVTEAGREAFDRARNAGQIDAVAHRMVHGGPMFRDPTLITPDVLGKLKALRELDPLHNPSEIALIEATQKLQPDTRAVVVFDTAFHKTLPETAWRYALPRALCNSLNLRRYGFHGISFQYVTGRLLAQLNRPAEGTRLIVCHLGSGASVCAVRDSRSVETSMGLTPLEGVVMGTRCGDVDPGLILYLLRENKMALEELDDILNKKSGLLGLSGLSNDVRKLEEASARGEQPAEIALDCFAASVRKYIGAYAASLGGLDALAFTGGIGEHSSDIRRRICGNLSFLGIELSDAAINAADGKSESLISASGSRVPVWVIPTNEELEIARQTHTLLDQGSK